MTRNYKAKKPIQDIDCILILHDIRSVVNVGAMFRTADAIGVRKIILSGTTPAPIDRFGRIRDDFAKSALGAEKSVSWERSEDILKILKGLKADKYTLYALEQSPKSIDYKEVSVKRGTKIALIPGAEVTGVPKDVLKLADYILEIPMYGQKESLNVSVATGIALYRLLDQ